MSRTTLYPNPARAVVEAIQSMQQKLEMPPTIAELKDYLELGSKRTVLRYLSQAQEQGLIERWPGARGVRVKDSVTLESVIRDLYSRELNCRISTFWDGGITIELGDAVNGFTESGNFDIHEIGMAAAWLLEVT